MKDFTSLLRMDKTEATEWFYVSKDGGNLQIQNEKNKKSDLLVFDQNAQLPIGALAPHQSDPQPGNSLLLAQRRCVMAQPRLSQTISYL